MKRPIPIGFDPELREALDAAADKAGKPVAAFVRQACAAYIKGLDSHWPALVEKAVQDTAAAIHPMTLALDAHKEAVSSLVAVVQKMARHCDTQAAELERANEDIQMLIAMVDSLAQLTAVIGGEGSETPLSAAQAHQRHARFLERVRDGLVSTGRRPSDALSDFHQILEPVPDPTALEPVTAEDRMSVNSFHLRGYIEKPVALRVLDKTKDRVANYWIITDGQHRHPISAIGRDAIYAATNFAVGDLVQVEGEQQTRHYQTESDKRTGRQHSVREFVANKQLLLEKATAGGMMSAADADTGGLPA